MAAGVRRFVHVSSITVHGNNVRGDADENSPLRIEPNPYSRSKVAAENLLRRMIQDEGAPVTIVRPGWIYGPRDRNTMPRLVKALRAGWVSVVGSGDNQLNVIYAADVADVASSNAANGWESATGAGVGAGDHCGCANDDDAELTSDAVLGTA